MGHYDIGDTHVTDWDKKQGTHPPAPVVSSGGSTPYYDIPPGSRDLHDLILHKNMPFAVGNIFKACYRFGEKLGTDLKYDLNKIIFFAQRQLEHMER